MKTLTEFVVRTADLVEAEGRLLRGVAVRVALGVAVIMVAAIAAAAGVALLLGSLYLATDEKIGHAASAALTGAVALCTGVVAAWMGRRMANQ